MRLPMDVINTDPTKGLSSQQAQQRLEGGWGNRVHDKATRTVGQILRQNCVTFFNLVFLVLAVFLLLTGSSVKNLTFLVVVVINTVIGCIQEIRAKRAVDRLTLMATQNLTVIRDGIALRLRSDLLVRDDIVEFHAGDQICADGVVRTGQLQVNEALLTGEADPVIKNAGDVLQSGSIVVAGSARAQLTRVGDDAYAAQLAAEAKANPKIAKSEMMCTLDKLIRVMGIILIPVGGLLFYQEYRVLQLDLQTSAEATVAALVGMIPEGLYLLTSIALAASGLKLAKQRVLVRDMNCIETLARVDVLCVDKTGTITEPGMEVENILPLTQDPPEYLEAVLTAICAAAEPENETGKALKEMFSGASDWESVSAIPFTSETKWSARSFREQGTFLTGAPEVILGNRLPELEAQISGWTAAGYRVLLCARYEAEAVPGGLLPEKVTPLALILLTGRIRQAAPETFAYFARQGVTVKVISGDNPATAAEIACRAGIADGEKYVDANLLETEEDFQKAVGEYTVFGRVTPEKKRALIRALKQQKHTVAMTGDGVNDVLAMKEADCAIAMASGAQAASQIAHLVLLDSDFSAMPGIVGEGRRVINNIQRAAALFLVKNIFSLFLSLLTMLTGWPYPMVPLHMSIISGLTIGFPSFFLAMEPNYERVQGRFLAGVLRRAFPGGLTNLLVVLLAQACMAVFRLSLEQLSTVCTAILSAVGLLVLFQVSKPFDRFRKLIWCAVAVALVGCFTLLRQLFELDTASAETLLAMGVLLLTAPTVFFAVQRVFDCGDRLFDWIRNRRKTHADL